MVTPSNTVRMCQPPDKPAPRPAPAYPHLPTVERQPKERLETPAEREARERADADKFAENRRKAQEEEQEVMALTSPVAIPWDPDFPVVWPPSTKGPATMSSLEIAELCEKRHDHVMRDIRTILAEAGIDAPKFGGVYLGGNGEERPCYHLPRFECDLVVSGYSVKYRAAIIRRWHELEAKKSAPRELTLRESFLNNLKLLDDNEEKDRQLQAQALELTIKDEQIKEAESFLREEQSLETEMDQLEFKNSRPPTTPTFAIVVKDGPLGVDLRELHRELESKQEFANWAKAKLSQFIEGQDFVLLDNVVKQTGSGGHNRIDYAVSIECAKHIAMMENTERGRQVRQYFIECEKVLKASHTPTTPALPTYPEALRALADAVERDAEKTLRLETQSKLLEAQAPAVKFVEDYRQAAGEFCIQDAAGHFLIPRS